MDHRVFLRRFQPGDEISCKELIKKSVMSSLNATFRGMLFKEITFQLMILLSAIMFIFFEMPLTICLMVIPIVVVLIFASTYIAFILKLAEINKEVNDIPRLYMSNAFSCFWVVEALKPRLITRLPSRLITRQPKEDRYTIMVEHPDYRGDMITSVDAKIVGTIGLSKSHRLDKCAWIKRLCVHKEYQRKGIASSLLNTAVQFAIRAGYSCVNTVTSEYIEGGKELCLKKGFELDQMYHKPILGSYVTILMYEFTYRIKSSEDDYLSQIKKKFLIEQNLY